MPESKQKHVSKSMTTRGIVVLAILFALDRWRLDVSEAQITEIVELCAGLAGIAVALYGRWRKGDLYIKPRNGGSIVKLLIASLIATALIASGCAQAPTTANPVQTSEQRAGQGDNYVQASAADAQSGIGENPNRHGEESASGETEVQVEGSRTVTVRGSIRTLIVGDTIEYSPSASATVSGTTSGTDQGQSGSSAATQTPTANTDVSPTTNVSGLPGVTP